MSSALSEIDQRIDSRCLVRSMDKGGCTLDTTDAPAPFRIIDLDHAAAPVRSTARKCDYLFLAETDDGGGLRHVVPLELKATSLNAGTVTSQLQAGARIAEHIVQGIAPASFTPVAAYGRKPHRRQYRKLAEVSVKFRNRPYAIVATPCDSSLSSALE